MNADEKIIVKAEVITRYAKGKENDEGGFEAIIERDTIEVEVLTVHFKKRTMRVRYVLDSWGEKKVYTVDISAEPFFEQYKISKI